MPSRTEIVTAMSNSVCHKAGELIGGSVIKNGSRVVQYAGGYTNVFPFINKDGKKVAIRCWCADIDQARERCQRISEFLKKDTSHYFVNFKYVDNALLIAGTLHPVVVMDWVEGQTLKNYVNEQKPSKALFLDLAAKFIDLVKYLHSQNIAHGDLQHGNIMVRPDDSLALIDYDSMYVDSLNGFTDVVKGLPGYQHPARDKNRILNPKLDYFSELVIYLSLHIFAESPELWDEYVDTEDLLFSMADFADLKHSKLYAAYCHSANPTISRLMQELENALGKDDINKLEPIESLLGSESTVRPSTVGINIDNILSKMKTTPTYPAKTVVPDVDGILSKINRLMAAIETHEKLPEIDVSQIIKKFTLINKP
jgi:serine/threonine protein kinase